MNTQKHSIGRDNNKRQAKQRKTETNRIYPIHTDNEFTYYIDDKFEDDYMLGKHKTIYITIDSGYKTPICYIDETVTLDCTFMDNLLDVVMPLLEPVVVVTSNTDYYFIDTMICWDGYDSASRTIRSTVIDGCYYSTGVYEVSTGWVNFVGHSERLAEKGKDTVDLEAIKQMNSIEFMKYVSELEYVQ